MQVLNRVLNEYPQAIVFAGHSHYPVGDPRSIHQGANPDSAHKNYYTVINTGSTTYAEIHRDVDDNPLNKELYAGGNSPVFDDDCVFRYLVNVYNVATGKIEGKASIFSRFYLNSDMPDQFTQIIGNLQSGTDYRIEVKALDSYDNESKPLVATFTTR